VSIAQLIGRGRKVVVKDSDHTKPARDNDFKLVYASGVTQNKKVVIDKEFQVEAENTVKIYRKVEMFQWVERSHRNDRNDSVNYSYERQWLSHLVASESFHEYKDHINPTIMPYSDQTFTGKKITFGGYVLAES
jgi:Transmembrane protein 43